jgi:1-deoxy-D-xylulose-5-phosphate reductoisomerase
MQATMASETNSGGRSGRRRLAILGATGSIGRQTLEVLDQIEGFEVCALAAGSNWQLLAEQAQKHRPAWVALADGEADQLRNALPEGTEVLSGQEAMTELIRRARPDMVVTAVVGAAGLAPTLAAIEVGADIALANKETLAAAGQIVMPAAQKAGIRILPVDSEHSGIFQCLEGSKRTEVEKIVLTASGGALRQWPEEELAGATIDDALDHPTWRMGSKITVDCATLINKALEVIEAHWLFGLEADQIEVVIHPESIIHAMVHYRDGSVLAQMGPPDMRTPIAYALTWPDRAARPCEALDLARLGQLTFQRPEGRFARALDLAYRVIEAGSTSGAILNAANEVAVQAFLEREISFAQITATVENTLNQARLAEEVTLESLARADAWARTCARELLSQAPPATSKTSKSE